MKPTKEQFLVALREIEKFSPAPVILSKALQLLRDPLSDISSIGTLVARDGALAAEIIRCANSVYFGGSTSSTIDEAVQKIGTRETIRILNLAVARIVSSRELGCYGIHGDAYWAESLFHGLFMEALARETGECDPDEAYTVGLLRYIGRLAINQAIENMHYGLFWDGRESVTQWELENVGIVQAQAGAILLERWRFTPNVVEAIGAQDTPAILPRSNWLADALFFASGLLPQGVGAPLVAAAAGGPALEPLPIGSEFMHRHDLNYEAVERLLQNTSEAFDEVRQKFVG